MEEKKSTRRSYLKGIGVLAGMATGAVGVGSADAPAELDDFEVEGTIETRVKYRPDEIEVRRRKRSEDLARRYGLTPPILEDSLEIDRAEIEDDQLPERGVDTFTEEWHTYLATEDEWRAAFAAIDDREVGAQHDHRYYEDYEDYCYWIYENTEGDIYDVTSPINVIFDFSLISHDIDDVTTVLGDEGWANYIAEWTRYAWDTPAQSFVAQEATMASARFGVSSERYHARYWQMGDYVSMQAHVDDPAWPDGHQVASYDEAEDEVVRIFRNTSHFYYLVQEDEYYLYNWKGDHDGYATRIY